MNTTTKTVARVADVPTDLAEFFRSMPHYRAREGRDARAVTHGYGEDAYTVHYDPLSTQGTHRSEMVLTGYIYAGERNGHRFYVLRFDRHADQSWTGSVQSVFYTAQVSVAHPAITGMIYAADYEKSTERTRSHALNFVQTLLASTDDWRGDCAADLRRNFREDLADEVGAWSDEETEDLRDRIPSPLAASMYVIRQDRYARESVGAA